MHVKCSVVSSPLDQVDLVPADLTAWELKLCKIFFKAVRWCMLTQAVAFCQPLLISVSDYTKPPVSNSKALNYLLSFPFLLFWSFCFRKGFILPCLSIKIFKHTVRMSEYFWFLFSKCSFTKLSDTKVVREISVYDSLLNLLALSLSAVKANSLTKPE